MLPRKKVLLIAYLFPPTGGAGVQRVLKFVKYLSQFGWDPVVLTVKDIEYHVHDYSLLDEIPDTVQVIRTESLDPQRLTARFFPRVHSEQAKKSVNLNPNFREGSAVLAVYRFFRDMLVVPDFQVAWMPFAYKAGVRAIREQRIDAIIADMPPHSLALLAKMISKKTGVPYLLDFRDGWVDYPDYQFATSFHKSIHKDLERRALSKAAAITVWGEPLKQSFAERYPLMANRIEVLTNGFDECDLEGAELQAVGDKFRIVYQGSLNAYQENSFAALLVALRGVPEELRHKLEFVFVGRSSVAAQRAAIEAGLQDTITFVPYLPHKEALGYLRSAHASLLLISEKDSISLTGKLFEYLMVGAPIIASVSPEGACAKLLRQAGLGQWITPPCDADSLRRTIIALAEAGWPRPEASAVDQFSRRRITERLAGVLDRMVGAPPA